MYAFCFVVTLLKWLLVEEGVREGKGSPSEAAAPDLSRVFVFWISSNTFLCSLERLDIGGRFWFWA
jgi:hypothetical protein